MNPRATSPLRLRLLPTVAFCLAIGDPRWAIANQPTPDFVVAVNGHDDNPGTAGGAIDD